MALSEADAALYVVRLAEAKAALHELLIGKSARVFVDQNGERVEYTAANRSALAAYINEIERLLNTTTVTGPMKVVF